MTMPIGKNLTNPKITSMDVLDAAATAAGKVLDVAERLEKKEGVAKALDLFDRVAGARLRASGIDMRILDAGAEAAGKVLDLFDSLEKKISNK